MEIKSEKTKVFRNAASALLACIENLQSTLSLFEINCENSAQSPLTLLKKVLEDIVTGKEDIKSNPFLHFDLIPSLINYQLFFESNLNTSPADRVNVITNYSTFLDMFQSFLLAVEEFLSPSQSNHFQSIAIPSLLDEMWVLIFDFTNPEDISAIERTNKRFRNLILNNNYFWNKKFKRHFPIIHQKISSLNISWHAQFIKAYKLEYEKLTANVRKMFSMLKEGDLTGLAKLPISFEHLILKDKNGYTLSHWARVINNHAILRYFYQLAIKFYLTEGSVDHKKRDSHERGILYWAISLQQPLSDINTLILGGSDIFSKTSSGNTPLHLAIRRNRIDIVKLLIEKNCDINSATNTGITPLMMFAFKGKYELLDYFLKRGANIHAVTASNSTALHAAAQVGHLPSVEILLEFNANPNAKRKDDVTALHLAAERGDVIMSELLLDKGANVNSTTYQGITPLYFAAQNNALPLIIKLLKYRANIDAASNFGITPLGVACHQGHKAIVEYLIDQGADINFTVNGSSSPLYIAVFSGQTAIVELLLDRGADINLHTLNGGTALHAACYQGYYSIVEKLLANRARLDLTDNQHHTPLQVADSKGHKEIVDLLNNYSIAPTLPAK